MPAYGAAGLLVPAPSMLAHAAQCSCGRAGSTSSSGIQVSPSPVASSARGSHPRGQPDPALASAPARGGFERLGCDVHLLLACAFGVDRTSCRSRTGYRERYGSRFTPLPLADGNAGHRARPGSSAMPVVIRPLARPGIGSRTQTSQSRGLERAPSHRPREDLPARPMPVRRAGSGFYFPA